MKTFYLLLIGLLFMACSTTKKIVKQAPTPTPEVTSEKEKEPDTIVTTTTKVLKYNDSLLVPPSEEPIKTMDGLVIKPKENTPVFSHASYDDLLQKHVSPNGNVNYEGFKTDWSTLRNYIAALGENTPLEEWSKADKLVYWINAYNAMTIDLILRHYPLKSIKDIKTPWKQRYWKLGEKWYNLNDIEHQILRKMDEPRIHFAIVCASFSCPKLQNKAFSASNLDMQLTEATKEFLADTKRNSISESDLELSKIFQWFAKDFKQNGTLIDFINQYTNVNISQQAKKRFMDYNWDLND